MGILHKNVVLSTHGRLNRIFSTVSVATCVVLVGIVSSLSSKSHGIVIVADGRIDVGLLIRH